MPANVNLTGLNQYLDQVKNLVPNVMPDAYREFRRRTPIRTGQARRSTKLVRNRIEARYAYADSLDRGRRRERGRWYGSRQAPDGMSTPTMKYLRDLIRRYLQRAQRRR